MPLKSCPTELIDVACRLADESGPIVRSYFRKSFAVEEKRDLSPVTAADRKAEQAMHALLARLRPDDGVIGEEFGAERGESEFVWVLDPIDGTRSFASGKLSFGSLISLLHEGEPILGIIDQPILNERWVGAVGHTTKFNGEVCRARQCAQLSGAIANMGTQAFPFGNAVSLDAYRRIAKKVLMTSTSNNCYSYGLLAMGHVDLCIEHDLKLYDFAALVPVIEGAGGAVTDWQGKKLNKSSPGQVLAVSDLRLLSETVKLLEGAL